MLRDTSSIMLSSESIPNHFLKNERGEGHSGSRCWVLQLMQGREPPRFDPHLLA
jgi:hypothetical protein